MYVNQNILTTISVRRLECAGHLVSISDDRTIRKYFWGNQMDEKKQEDEN
jgi:hypothetical protein